MSEPTDIDRRRSMKEITEARQVIIQHLNNPKLFQSQRTTLNAMLTALCWVQQSPFGSTLADLIAGRELSTKGKANRA